MRSPTSRSSPRGPYKLDGKWDGAKGGTFVRNDQWDPKTDSVRKAYPDKVVYQQGHRDATIQDRLFADSGNDQFAVTDRRLTPEFFSRIPEAKDRYTQVESPYVDYLVPNFNRHQEPEGSRGAGDLARREGMDPRRWWRQGLQAGQVDHQPRP